MPLGDYSNGGSSDRYQGPVESAVRTTLATGKVLSAPNLQAIGKVVDDEIDKVKASAPKKVRTPGEVSLIGYNWLLSTLDRNQVGNHFLGDIYGDTNTLVNGYKSGAIYPPGTDIGMVSREGTKDAEIIMVGVWYTYGRSTGVDRDGWSGPPHGDDFDNWLSGVNACMLQPTQGQVTGNGNTLCITMYNHDVSSGSYYGDAYGLYQIYYHGFYTGQPRYDTDAKVWVGRIYHINEAMIVYTDRNGKQHITRISN